ncbi:MAG: Uncharacterized protein G01um10143_576 [Parcubacteria group bacterium Gr01-1014_3]|nr:MAG: Uncharacterized protein G01um10143_576 [Parcubacteria group bacterium Gr01-1014_3]
MRREIRKIGVGTVKISALGKKYVNQAMDNDRLSYGPFLRRFENEFAALHDRKFAISCNSGTSALQIALGAMKEIHGWKDGDEVIVPSITFIATSNIVLQNGMKPVFVDVDSLTCNMDPNKIEAKITDRTRAIIPVHLFGLSAEMEPIMKIAKKHNLKVIEDSCETMFVKYKGAPVGSRGDISCFSTYTAHLVVTGVGGLALTNNPEYAVVMKSMMNHGRDSIYLNIDADDALRSDKEILKMADRRFSFIRMGYSFRLTELEGALGVAELVQRTQNLKNRLANAKYLIAGLSKYKDLIQLPSWPKYAEHAFMMFPLVVKHPKLKRDEIITYLEKNGIETRYLMPLINQPYYKKIFGDIESKYPVAAWINKNGFYVGCHQTLNKKDLDYMIEVFSKFLNKWI